MAHQVLGDAETGVWLAHAESSVVAFAVAIEETRRRCNSRKRKEKSTWVFLCGQAPRTARQLIEGPYCRSMDTQSHGRRGQSESE